MTRQEAIKYLIKVRDNCDLDRCPEFNSLMDAITCANCTEAFDIAIEALKQLSLPQIIIKQGEQETEDLISRQDAIDALVRSSVYAWSVEEDQIAHDWALKIISELPAKG